MTHHKPHPIYGGRYGKLIGYVCDCCDRIFTPKMQETGPRLSNQPPRTGQMIVHQVAHTALHFHHWDKEWGRVNQRHAARVAARSKG